MYSLTTPLTSWHDTVKNKLNDNEHKELTLHVLARPMTKHPYRVWKDGKVKIKITQKEILIELKLKGFVSSKPIGKPMLTHDDTSVAWDKVLISDYQIAGVQTVIREVMKLIPQ